MCWHAGLRDGGQTSKSEKSSWYCSSSSRQSMKRVELRNWVAWLTALRDGSSFDTANSCSQWASAKHATYTPTKHANQPRCLCSQ
jgi:hypothetical protein